MNVQQIQDEIFKKMSTNERVMFGSKLWLLAKEIVKDRPLYGTERSK
jgi:hypothetical protein